jgi:CHASE1-domain containing sensor protein
MPDPAPKASLGRRLGEILGLAAAYVGTGKLALLLAIPPGFATAIWPPAGIALAALLLLGSRAWPGVLLGSFLVNVSTTFDRASMGPSLAVAAAIAVGASAQALLGASLVRRFLGTPLELLRGRDISTFLVLGGPASCAVSATVGVATLYVRNVIQIREIPFNWWTWWVGDVIGVAVVAPLVLVAFGTPREVWRRRTVSVALPLGILLVLTTALFGFVRLWERSRVAAHFNVRADALVATIEGRVRESIEVLHSLESFRASSPQFDCKTFQSFAERALSRSPSLRALSWNPRVADAERDAFERGGPEGSDGPCRITERNAKESLVPAPRRSEYVPVRYIEPYKENASVVGFDVSSSIVRFEAMQRAGDTGKPTATRRLRLMQDGDESPGVLVFLPAYAKAVDATASEDERRRNLIGYFVGAVRLDAFFAFLEGETRVQGIDVQIHSGAGQGREEQLLWRTSRASDTPAEIRHATTRTYWGRACRVDCSATPEYVAATQSWRPWSVLAGGLSAAGLLGAFLLATTGRAVLIERNRTGS